MLLNQYITKIRFLFLYILILSVFQVQFLEILSLSMISENPAKFRNLAISENVLDKFYGRGDFIQRITENMLTHNFSLIYKRDISRVKSPWKRRISKKVYDEYYNYYKMIFSDLKYFPVAEDVSGGVKSFYSESWMDERTYGGRRGHEGTDIMSGNNLRGYFPVVSITDGIVERMGWLEKGGYRIGIRSTHGAYFYYAHLYEYEPGLKVGDTVKAGDVIATMGDSGYGKKEGTVGMFDVHLHVGIYINTIEGEISVNPYWILRYLERKKMKF